MRKLILTIAEIVIKMMKKRNLDLSKKLHEETHSQYQLFKKLEVARNKTVELEDKLALAETVLKGVEAVAGDKVPKAVEVLSDKVEAFNKHTDKIFRTPLNYVFDKNKGEITEILREAEEAVLKQKKGDK